jgi:hypothetical protein
LSWSLAAATIGVAEPLPGPSQLRPALLELAGIIHYAALDLHHPVGGYEAAREQLAVGLQVGQLQRERALHARDLCVQGAHLLLDALALNVQQGDLARQRIAARLEQRALLGERLSDAIVGRCRLLQLGGEHERRGTVLLRLEPGEAGALHVQAVLEPISLRVHSHVSEHDDRIARAHALTVANEHGAHDAAFEVLYRAPVHVDLDEGGRNHRHRQRRGHHPGAQR